ncbi:MAG: hypothetical protein EOP38_28395 [Rubrivivax sp.]|nr:MAG: hypothetical protein EOP38_28395 [Rubrivivax sp.]
MLRKIIKVAGGLLIVLLVTSLLHDYWWRCSSGGLDRDDALKIAKERLEDLEKRYGTKEFVLKASEKESTDWLFTYEFKGCTVDIIIDKCGVADVGGMSSGCSRSQ